MHNVLSLYFWKLNIIKYSNLTALFIFIVPYQKKTRRYSTVLSFFKKPVNTVNNDTDESVNIPESSCAALNNDVNSENVSPASNCFPLQEKPHHLLKDFVFPKTKFGSRNPRSCQHNWFDNYSWLHYDIEKKCGFFFYFMKNISKLTAEKNKKLPYTSVGFRHRRKRHQSILKIAKTVNATKKQQPWRLSLANKLDLCKIGNDFI